MAAASARPGASCTSTHTWAVCSRGTGAASYVSVPLADSTGTRLQCLEDCRNLKVWVPAIDEAGASGLFGRRPGADVHPTAAGGGQQSRKALCGGGARRNDTPLPTDSHLTQPLLLSQLASGCLWPGRQEGARSVVNRAEKCSPDDASPRWDAIAASAWIVLSFMFLAATGSSSPPWPGFSLAAEEVPV